MDAQTGKLQKIGHDAERNTRHGSTGHIPIFGGDVGPGWLVDDLGELEYLDRSLAMGARHNAA